jgi:eukaryotic-like serine/threonine-protein kinase
LLARGAKTGSGVSEQSSCLSDELLFAFATGSIGESKRAHAEAHIADCADCRAVLAQAARGLEEGDPHDSGTGNRSRTIGRYRLSALLGAGAAGIVYRAFDPELERVVALKVLVDSAEPSTREPEDRILREARAMAQLSHPNVVTVFDVGLADAAVFIVMEYTPGTTLERWLHASARSETEIVSAFIAAGRGLAAAHAKRLVHRDFKPENVLVSSDGQVKVTDFGLARSLGSAEKAVLSGLKGMDVTTRTRGVFGTPAYMAPELFSGAPANAASDQFSFSVALLGALIGRHPFGADEGLRVSELILRMQKRKIDFSGIHLPPGLKAALLRGVSPEPAERFHDIPALLAALEREVDAARRPRRRLTALAAAAALALVLAAAVFLRPRPAATAMTTGNPTRPFAENAQLLASLVGGTKPPAVSGSQPRAENAGVPLRSHSSTAAARKVQKRQRSKPPEAVRYNDALREPF